MVVVPAEIAAADPFPPDVVMLTHRHGEGCHDSQPTGLPQPPLLLPHHHHHHGNMALWASATLLVADCVGVGILALPHAVSELGWARGGSFLIVNLLVNGYAGTILAQAATRVESTAASVESLAETETEHPASSDDHDPLGNVSMVPIDGANKEHRDVLHTILQHRQQEPRGGAQDTGAQVSLGVRRQVAYSAIKGSSDDEDEEGVPPPRLANYGHHDLASPTEVTFSPSINSAGRSNMNDAAGAASATSDLVGMTRLTFRHSPVATHWTMLLYYTNLFLVLGDYVLVQTRAVMAMSGNQLCFPLAGLLACVLMLALCQYRTMARLGRSASVLSLLALAVVLLQCLYSVAHQRPIPPLFVLTSNEHPSVPTSPPILRVTAVAGSWWSQFSALATIGFAVGTQKLLLNIRHEMRDRSQAPRTLALALLSFGTVYVLVIALAGPEPPSFLFEVIPPGWNRKLAGFLLWIHVAVSYAINSQALCSSLNRIFIPGQWAGWSDRATWFVITLLMVTSSYLVSNAIPFFKDLVALIGALTSVPLSLTLPALIHRRSLSFSSLWFPFPWWSCGSYLLLLYSLIFLVIGLSGAISSIGQDWAQHPLPFSCSSS